MMSRTATASVVGRSVAMRRMRRRAGSTAATRPYCRTNGCTSFLVVDPATNVATCAICGYTRHIH